MRTSSSNQNVKRCDQTGSPKGRRDMLHRVRTAPAKLLSRAVCLLAAALLPAGASGEILNESAKLLASDGAAGDTFGNSVSVSGDVAVVGAWQDDDNGSESGSVYVHRFSGSAWVEEQKLLASDGAEGDLFGQSVSVSGDVAVVGAPTDDDNGNHSGSAYVYRFSGNAWVEEQKLLPSDGAAEDFFGISVSVSGDVAFVGAFLDDDNGQSSGSVYVYRWNGSSWVEEQKLLASDGAAADRFGNSVSVSGDVAVVGAQGDDDNGLNAGSAYVYRFNGSAWVEEQKLLASDGAILDVFGIHVSVSGDVAVVAAVLDDDNGDDSGSAYAYRWNGSSWVEEQKLLPSDGAAGDNFGNSVSVSGNVAVVGARLDDDNGVDSGSAYAYRWNGSSWVEEQKLVPSDGAAGDNFGNAVSVSGDVAFVGASQDDDNGSNSGSAYVFDLAPACIRDPEWVCDGDVDGDGQVNPVDSGLVQSAFGSTNDQDLCNYDLDCDGQINPVDSGIVQSLFGTCEAPRSVCP